MLHSSEFHSSVNRLCSGSAAPLALEVDLPVQFLKLILVQRSMLKHFPGLWLLSTCDLRYFGG